MSDPRLQVMGAAHRRMRLAPSTVPAAAATTHSHGRAAAPAARLACTRPTVTAVGAAKSTLTGLCRVAAPLPFISPTRLTFPSLCGTIGP